MESIVERAGQATQKQLNRVRWALGINGVLSIAFAVVILVWPDISLFSLVIVFGAYVAAGGVFGLAAAISGRVRENRGWLVVWSLLSIAFGIACFAYTDMSALALLYVIGAYAVAIGVITIAGAFSLPLDGGDRALITLAGLVSIAFGIVMFAKPGDGALVLLALIAAFALVRGVAEVVVAVGWKRLFERELKRSLRRTTTPQPAS
jgi:uncharacterized membrane protein HdeD (DUF308 family)